ncbi:MAG: bifunctional 2-polyprenyl-6-hydroxyphenol methylase/3-demethylubiquinol 3-O-methyltransferase UbiG [Candidatus Paracaedibacteraceae bacterium]|nr:bifunctional 2-polyprenyl-6-hydroxyphenol methylase/3-demethylubiquinol 3-O-methyltransferase UbiG [Candidatus Paracaedibacteraceae bacterium]
MNSAVQTTEEIFSTLADTWWDENGPFKALHAMNPVRMQYMLEYIRKHFKDPCDVSILDVGCGGGLVCEPFARLGYNVTGIDQSSQAIQVAQNHAKEQELAINYYCGSIEDTDKKYDIITLLEVLEHVEDPQTLLNAAVKRLMPGGLIFFSTLNRTVYSYTAGIFLAENVLKWAPKGTHEWYKFLKPSEIIVPLNNMEIEMLNLSGITWKLLSRKWSLASNIGCNYIGVGKLK